MDTPSNSALRPVAYSLIILYLLFPLLLSNIPMYLFVEWTGEIR
jgi:hypothetical protein